jgi:hypothetical protein
MAEQDPVNTPSDAVPPDAPARTAAASIDAAPAGAAAPVGASATGSATAEVEAPPSPPPPAVEKKPRRPRVPLKKRLRTYGVRAYAGALALTVATVCGMALVYLFRAVFTPATLPPNFAEWEGRLDPTALRQAHVPGVTTGAGRAPIAHYHKVDRWFAPDPRNGCTVAGCHSPLPHAPESPIAAFVNLHVTFLDCRVCHEPIAADRPLAVEWVETETERARPVPAALQLIRLLEGLGREKADAVRAHPSIVALLGEVAAASGHDVEIDDLLAQIDSSVPDSPYWRKSVQQLARELPRHARGEYGAKVARQGGTKDAAAVARLTKTYLAAPAGGAERADLEKQLHRDIVPRPGACATCHAPAGKAFDFEAMGYSPRRARTLRTLPLAGMVEQIRAGESFQLPQLMEAENGR